MEFYFKCVFATQYALHVVYDVLFKNSSQNMVKLKDKYREMSFKSKTIGQLPGFLTILLYLIEHL